MHGLGNGIREGKPWTVSERWPLRAELERRVYAPAEKWIAGVWGSGGGEKDERKGAEGRHPRL